MFDLQTKAICTRVTVNVTDVTVEDVRDGTRRKLTFYRQGEAFPKCILENDLAKYGYKIVEVGQTDSIKGIMNWAEVFGKFIQQETEI